MAWDETIPSGSRDINLGDNDIRQLKADTRQFLAEEHVAITDYASTLTGYHKFPGGTTAGRPSADGNARRIYVNTSKNQINIENLSTASFPEGSPTWYGGGAVIWPTGTAIVFYQASPPTGWTAVALNDRALRVVSSGGTGGSGGGTTAFTSCWASTTTGSYDIGTLTHTVNASSEVVSPSGGTGVLSSNNFSVSSHSVGSHSHSVTSYAPLYSDVIIATMD